MHNSLTSKTISLPPRACSTNISTPSPGLNVEIVGSSGVFIVMDGSREDYCEDLQFCQPVLKGRFTAIR